MSEPATADATSSSQGRLQLPAEPSCYEFRPRNALFSGVLKLVAPLAQAQLHDGEDGFLARISVARSDMAALLSKQVADLGLGDDLDRLLRTDKFVPHGLRVKVDLNNPSSRELARAAAWCDLAREPLGERAGLNEMSFRMHLRPRKLQAIVGDVRFDYPCGVCGRLAAAWSPYAALKSVTEPTLIQCAHCGHKDVSQRHAAPTPSRVKVLAYKNRLECECQECDLSREAVWKSLGDQVEGLVEEQAAIVWKSSDATTIPTKRPKMYSGRLFPEQRWAEAGVFRKLAVDAAQPGSSAAGAVHRLWTAYVAGGGRRDLSMSDIAYLGLEDGWLGIELVSRPAWDSGGRDLAIRAMDEVAARYSRSEGAHRIGDLREILTRGDSPSLSLGLRIAALGCGLAPAVRWQLMCKGVSPTTEPGARVSPDAMKGGVVIEGGRERRDRLLQEELEARDARRGLLDRERHDCESVRRDPDVLRHLQSWRITPAVALAACLRASLLNEVAVVVRTVVRPAVALVSELRKWGSVASLGTLDGMGDFLDARFGQELKTAGLAVEQSTAAIVELAAWEVAHLSAEIRKRADEVDRYFSGIGDEVALG